MRYGQGCFAAQGAPRNDKATILPKPALHIYGRQWRPAADQVGGFFGDHDHGGVDVASDQVGHDGGVDDAQAVDAKNLEVGIDDRRGIGRPRHFAGAERVVHGDSGRPDVGVDGAV